MSIRNDILLKDIKKSDVGLEIGPSHNPAASKKEGFNCETIDHMSQEELKEKYKNHLIDLEAIEAVDYVWKGGNYSDLTGKIEYYDYIIAAQIIEHTTDFIGFLKDCSLMINENGFISLSVPDKRYCFDHYRPITSIAQVINDYYCHQDFHSPGSCAEYFLNVVNNNGNIAWGVDDEQVPVYQFVHTLEYALESIDTVNRQSKYYDIHEYKFTPSSFTLMINDLNALGFLDLVISSPIQNYGHEIFFTLKKQKKKLDIDYKQRMYLLENIEFELSSKKSENIKTNIIEENPMKINVKLGIEKELDIQQLHNDDLKKLSLEYEDLRSKHARLEMENQLIKESTCWKITRPLRFIINKIRK